MVSKAIPFGGRKLGMKFFSVWNLKTRDVVRRRMCPLKPRAFAMAKAEVVRF